MKTERPRVYKVIDGERDYQEAQIINNDWTNPKRIGEYLTVLRVLLTKAEQDWYKESDVYSNNTLSQIRKIAATSVACMETHGAPERK